MLSSVGTQGVNFEFSDVAVAVVALDAVVHQTMLIWKRRSSAMWKDRLHLYWEQKGAKSR